MHPHTSLQSTVQCPLLEIPCYASQPFSSSLRPGLASEYGYVYSFAFTRATVLTDIPVNISPKNSVAQSERVRPSSNRDPGPVPSTPSTKKRRAPNAFILFRSTMIAKRLIPPELTHQNDVSCYVAEKWRSMSASERGHFFKMADEHRKRLESEPAPERKERMAGRHQTGANAQPASSYTFPSDAYARPAPGFPTPTVSTKHEQHGIALLMLPQSTGLSGEPAAPQAVRAIPPELLHWDHDDSSDPGFPYISGDCADIQPPTFWPSEYDLEHYLSAFANEGALPNSSSTSSVDTDWQQYLGLDNFSSFPYA